MSILAALSDRVQFVVYRLAPKEGGGTDKIPVNPETLRDITAHDPANWMRPEVAKQWAAYLGEGYGVGIVLWKGCNLAAIDIDKALVDGQWSPLAQALCARFAGAYQEVSPSQTGIHIFFTVRGDIPPHRKKNGPLHIEFYDELRFLTVTEINCTGDVLFDATDMIPQLIADYFPPGVDVDATDWTEEPNAGWDGPEDDDELIRRILASKSVLGRFGSRATIQDLWTANVDGLARAFPAQSEGKAYDASSADQALFNHLAFWTGGNCERMAELAKRSSLIRPKWQRGDYFRGTILKSASWQQAYYKQQQRDSVPQAAVPGVVIPPAPSFLPTQPTLGEFPAPPPRYGGLPPNVAPATPPAAMGRGDVVTPTAQEELFANCAYVQDIHRIVNVNGFLLTGAQFDVEFGGREFIMRRDGANPSKSAWTAFTQSEVTDFPKVRGTLFDPLTGSGLTVLRDGQKYINVYLPVEIRAVPGDVTRFLRHLEILWPKDWRILLNYLKFMVQHKGLKSKWWPFLQGVPGNGKSWISDTMEYCLGQKYTQRPTPKNIDSQFNASLYACLFIALEDVKVKEDHGALWETLKPMVTQGRIEIQPKGVDKVTREVCFNGILNSNHKDGIRKEPDDRRIAPFFAAQQRKRDLERDGLTLEYFTDLWNWSQADGWAHIAHYLASDPIDEEYNPATKCQVAPITSSTAEAISLGMGPAEQELVEAIKYGIPGFRGGWICMAQFEILMKSIGRARFLTPAKRANILETMGYEPHPAFPEGRLPFPLNDGSLTSLYVTTKHPSASVTDPLLIKSLYEAAQKL